MVIARHSTAEAAVSKGRNQQLEVGGINQGGGTTSSSKFRQQAAVGEAIAGTKISSARFRLSPGFLGAALSVAPAVPTSDLDLTVLYAKTEPLGPQITQKLWQQDADPLYLWEPPATGLDLAGYSYAMDAQPDDIVDTTATSYDVSLSPAPRLADGKHVFTVKALNTAGQAGKPLSFEVWVDTTPPQITAYAPSPGGLLNALDAAVSATVVDAASGVTAATVTLSVNGSASPITFDGTAGVVTSVSPAWKEGTNSVELRVTDAVGNALAPLVWSVTVDTMPPVGTLVMNGGSAMTTSVHVTLGLSASDATSGVVRVLLSNDELTGYVEEPYVALRELWKLNPVRGLQRVYAKFVDGAGNISDPVFDEIDLGLLAPDTVITSGPAGFVPSRDITFNFLCPEGDCVFAFAFDGDAWSDWSQATTATKSDLTFGNHYFRVKAAREVNGIQGIQPDEEDASPAERTWIVGVEPSMLTVPKGPPIKLWRLE